MQPILKCTPRCGTGTTREPANWLWLCETGSIGAASGPRTTPSLEVRGYLANVLRRTNPLPGETQSLFPLGQTVITPAAKEALSDLDAQVALKRHQRGDWGDCSPEDTAENELALTEGFRLFSVYHTEQRVKFWVITEADRSSTCILLPEDY